MRTDVTNDEVQALKLGLDKLKEIEGVQKTEFGVQESMYDGYADRSKGYSHGFIVILDSREALKNYNDDRRHIEFRDGLVVPLVDKTKQDPVMALDWEIPSASL